MHYAITSANIFSGQSAVTSRIFPVQPAVSVRKSTPDRPCIFPILQARLNRSLAEKCLLQNGLIGPKWSDDLHPLTALQSLLRIAERSDWSDFVQFARQLPKP